MAIELEPRSAAAYSGLGLLEHLSGRHEESIARYHEVRPLSVSLASKLMTVIGIIDRPRRSTNFRAFQTRPRGDLQYHLLGL